jgi:hypothetical protein
MNFRIQETEDMGKKYPADQLTGLGLADLG